MVFLNIQDDLGQAKGHTKPGVGREQGLLQGIDFYAKLLKQKMFSMYNWVR